MSLVSILIMLAIGAVAGWLAGLITKGAGFGLIGDIVIGILGAIVGGFLFARLGISLGTGLINEIVSATAGAVVLLVVIGLIRKIVR
jgi:uncharacterized membrane protein YeaQ/YmgE (transglycosylase-associated protein family)